MLVYIALALALVFALLAAAVYRHQRLLRDRALLMREAIRHRDFMFRLPTRGLLFGERALQQTLNDMGQEIEKLIARNEVEAWQRLTRVLTHEIMNATAPIQAVSQAYLQSPQIKGAPYEEGIRAIYDTSRGLAAFVESYRKMTQLQKPVPTDVNLQQVASTLQAMYPALTWHVHLDEAPTVFTDAHLLLQIMVNMAKNAAEAGATHMGLHWHDRLLISNDGQPIPSDVRREIFVPFFTTKRTGSGIGLSLSRRMMVQQGGSLELADTPHTGFNVTFLLRFALQA